jgi:hypothetical protein
MNFRLMLLTSGLLSGIALGGCSREELAPWFPQELQIDCQDVPPAVLGQPYSFDLNLIGGLPPLTVTAENLPMGLTVDNDGVISGTPTEEGTFDFRITVTDADGKRPRVRDLRRRSSSTRPTSPMIQCTDDSGSIPDGFVGVDYSFKIDAPGGVVPYMWSAAKGLPPGLTLTPDNANGISDQDPQPARPTTKGSYAVDITIVDASGVETTASCGDLIISDPISVDTDSLLKTHGGCVPLGVTLAQLSDRTRSWSAATARPISCELRQRPRQWQQASGTASTTPMPPGIWSSTTAPAPGAARSAPTLPFGIYAYITTFTQTGLKAYVPYCAPQMTSRPRPPTTSSARTPAATPPSSRRCRRPSAQPRHRLRQRRARPEGHRHRQRQRLRRQHLLLRVRVRLQRAVGQMASVSANPNSKFPAQGFDGFTHALRVTDDLARHLPQPRLRRQHPVRLLHRRQRRRLRQQRDGLGQARRAGPQERRQQQLLLQPGRPAGQLSTHHLTLATPSSVDSEATQLEQSRQPRRRRSRQPEGPPGRPGDRPRDRTDLARPLRAPHRP